jgi:hypothetical protein
MPIHSLRKILSRRSLLDDHRDDADTKSVSSAKTSMPSKSRRPKSVSSPTAGNRPTLGAFFNVSKLQQVNIAPRRSKLNRQKQLDVRKNRKSSILASLDRFIDGDRDEGTVVTTETLPAVSDHSAYSSHHIMSPERRSRPVPSKRHDSSQSVGGGEAPPRKERYRRRGSVTKFSLDDQQDGSSREFDDSVSILSIGADSVQSDSVLQNSGSTSTTTPRPRYRRRGSVTKFSLDEQVVKQPKVQKDFDDTSIVSLSSFAGDSVQSDKVLVPPPGRRYRRRNSVTKFSLESTTERAPRKKDTLSSSNSSALPVSSTIGGDSNGSFSSSLGNVSTLCDEDSLGYSSTTMHQSLTSPPRATPPSPDPYGYGQEETDSVSQRPPRKERYRRRGSVTKYSLEQAQDQVKKELLVLQADPTSTSNKKERKDSSTVNKELVVEDSSNHSIPFEELVARFNKRSSTPEASPPPRRYPRKNRLPSQPIS